MSQQHHVASHAQQELAIKPSINTLAQGSMFWQPEFRRASPWLEHTPFLFWLVEALQPRQCVGLGREGVAHLALCQAIGRLRLNAHCFLVAEGAALEKDGSKLSSIEKEAQEIASEQYPTTSHWLNTTPTRAIQQFDEESIDLLLLNVSADDDSVDYLLDRWLSRLSPQGVVLLPGIARREPGCNVFRAFEALRERYPSFAFHHGDGLGVIAVGQQPTMLLHNLFSTVDSAASSRVVQDIFARLGRSCRDKLTTQDQRVVVQQLEDRLTVQQEKWQQAEDQQVSLSNKLAVSDSERSEMKKRLASQEERFAHERGRLAERVSSLEEFNHELKQELMRQRTQSEQALATLKEEQAKLIQELESKDQALEKVQQNASTRFEELAKLTKLLKISEQTLEKAQVDIKQTVEERDIASNQVKALQTELAQAQHDTSTRFEELAKLTKLLEISEKTLEKTQVDIKQIVEERDIASNQVKALQTELAQAQQDTSTRFEELAKLTKLLKISEQTLEKAQFDIKQTVEERDIASNQVKTLQTELAQAQQDASTRFEELAKLTKLLENGEQTLEKAQVDIKKTVEERDISSNQVKALQIELAQAQQDTSTRFEELAKLTTLLEANEKALAQEREAVAQLNTQLSQQQDALARPSQEAEALKRQLEQQRQEAKVFADERFSELAILTELLEKKDTDGQHEIDRQARELAALVALLEERGIDYSAATLSVRRGAEPNISTDNSASSESNLALPLTAKPSVVKKATPLNKRAIKRQVALIESSRYFDAHWYLTQYSDIARDAKMSADPARHYLLIGGFEGRNPGPDFDSAYYLATHTDVAQSDINPLIHFLKFGENEQRSIKG